MSDPFGIPYGYRQPVRAPYNKPVSRSSGGFGSFFKRAGAGIGNILGRGIQSIQQQGIRKDPLDEMREQLYGILYGPMDQASLEAQARSQSAGIYGPQIEAIRQLMSQQEETAARNKEEVGRLFQALSGNIRTNIPIIERETEAGQTAVKQQYEQSKSAVGELYDQLQQEQMDLFNKLNIQAAAPDVLPGQAADEAFFKNLAEMQSTQTRDYLGTIGAGSEEFTRQGAQLALTEGTQRQSDIMTQLADILSGYEQDITGLQGQQTASTQEILQGLISGEQGRRRQEVGDIMGIENFLKGMAPEQREAPKPIYEGMRGVTQVLTELGQPGLRGWVNSFIGETAQEPSFGRFDPAAVARQAADQAREEGMTSRQADAIAAAVLAFYGDY